MMSAFDAIVTGRVQLVMYRAHTQTAATHLGIVGEVENLADGTVRVHAEGEKDKLDALTLALKKGSWLSRVDDVDVTWVEPSGRYTKFLIRYS